MQSTTDADPMPSLNMAEPLIPAFIEPITDGADTKRQRLQDQFEILLRQAEHEDEFGLAEEDFDLVDELQCLGMQHNPNQCFGSNKMML